MSRRRALLLGVPEYDSKALLALPAVVRDLDAMHLALEKNDYQVTSRGRDSARERASGRLRASLGAACRAPEPADVLLLYFSGHGIHRDGTDYLVPADAMPDEAHSFLETLVPLDVAAAVEESGASTVIFFIDACRSGVDLGAKTAHLAQFGASKRVRVRSRSLVYVFGCEPGEICQYVRDEDAEDGEGFSLFTRALAQALTLTDGPRTLGDVIAAAQMTLENLVRRHGKARQRIRVATESDASADPKRQVIVGSGVRLAAAAVRDCPWGAAARASVLWELPSVSATHGAATYRDAAVAVATWSRAQAQASAARLPTDAWRDDGLPRRVVDAVDLLVDHLTLKEELSAAEAFLVVTAPFVREAIVARGIAVLADHAPMSLDARGGDVWRERLERTHTTHPQHVRRAQRLAELGKGGDHDTIASWLMYRCLFREPGLWQEVGDIGGAVKAAVGDPPPGLADALAPERLLAMARALHGEPERLDGPAVSGGLPAEEWVGKGARQSRVRTQALGLLLGVAGRMGLDVRFLSHVLLDHLGLSDVVTVAELHTAVTASRWEPQGTARALRATCTHPAVDFVLREHVAEAERVLEHVAGRAAAKAGGADALSHLPARLTPAIRAVVIDGVPAYQVPHLRFTLAQDEVRELLMGEQLYGDPTLAVRELYQNALDACRYRAARLDYLRQTASPPPPWEGRIDFVQAEDEDGRAYIECRDNGVGMDLRVLTACFAKAGRRFSDMPEFVEEQARWLKCPEPIHLYPNSQFGVGVLSYFMLADEIRVQTCRMGEDGRPGRKLDVHVSGSGSLFRVRDLGDGAAEDIGTRVRLVLSRTEYIEKGRPRRVDCVEILGRLLWVAEFPTFAQSGGGRVVWVPGKLRLPDTGSSGVPEWTHETGQPGLWWSSDGRILADGLWTDTQTENVIVDLRGPHRPRLTVDRKKALAWDRDRTVGALQSTAETIRGIPVLKLRWLFKLLSRWPEMHPATVNAVWRPGLMVEAGSLGRVEFTKLGWWSRDPRLIETAGGRGDEHLAAEVWKLVGQPGGGPALDERMAAHRMACFASLGLRLSPRAARLAASVSAIFMPEPGDEAVVRRLSGRWEASRPRVSVAQQLALSLDVGEEAPAVGRRLDRLRPLGIEREHAEASVDAAMRRLADRLRRADQWVVRALYDNRFDFRWLPSVGDEVVQDLQRLGVSLTAVEFASQGVDDGDRALLATWSRLDPQDQARTPVLWLRLSAELKWPARRVFEAVARLQLDPTSTIDVTTIPTTLVADRMDLQLLSRAGDGFGPWTASRVTRNAIAAVHRMTGVPVAELHARLDRLACVGITHTRR